MDNWKVRALCVFYLAVFVALLAILVPAALAVEPLDYSFTFAVDPDPFWEEEPDKVDTSRRWLPKTPLFEDGGPRLLCTADGL